MYSILSLVIMAAMSILMVVGIVQYVRAAAAKTLTPTLKRRLTIQIICSAGVLVLQILRGLV